MRPLRGLQGRMRRGSRAARTQGVDGHLGRSRGRLGPAGAATRGPHLLTTLLQPGPAPSAPPRPPCPLPGAGQSPRSGSTRCPGTRHCPAQPPGPQGTEARPSHCPSRCLGRAGRGELGADRRCPVQEPNPPCKVLTSIRYPENRFRPVGSRAVLDKVHSGSVLKTQLPRSHPGSLTQESVLPKPGYLCY